MLWISADRDMQYQARAVDLLIFGNGLIGSAVAKGYVRRTGAQVGFLPYSWTDATARPAQLADCRRRIVEQAQSGKSLAVLWAAGSGGFNSPQSVFDIELDAYADVLGLVQAAASVCETGSVSFHLVSSAGGLFEGQRFVMTGVEPVPERAYAATKLKQEAWAIERLSPICTVNVYRPSTVYGYSSGGRTGLILNLIKNGLSGKPTRIYGSADTIRDHIYVSDVARFILDNVLCPPIDMAPALVVSGKPTTMFEVISAVERVLQRKLILHFEKTRSNAQNNSYRHTPNRLAFVPTPLATGIRLTVEDWARSELFGSRSQTI